VDTEFRSKGLQIVAASDEEAATIDNFVRAKGVTYGVVQAHGLGRLYGARGIPHSFVVGRDGNVIWRGHPQQITSDMVSAWLSGLDTPEGSAPSARSPGLLGSLSFKMLAFGLLLAVVVVIAARAAAKHRQPATGAVQNAPRGYATQAFAAPPTPYSVPGQQPPQNYVDLPPLPPPQAAPVNAATTCSQCGAPLRPGRKTCMACGAKVA